MRNVSILVFVFILLSVLKIARAEEFSSREKPSLKECRLQYDKSFFYAPGTSDPLFVIASKIIDKIIGSSLLTPENFPNFISVLTSSSTSIDQSIQWEVVTAAGMCLNLPLNSYDFRKSRTRKMAKWLYDYRYGARDPQGSVIAASRNRVSVRYAPGKTTFTSPQCKENILSYKLFTSRDMLENPHAYYFSQATKTYNTSLPGREIYQRKILLTQDGSHLVSLRWVDDTDREDEVVYEVCAFPLVLPQITTN
jgi:hypothetical protein